MSRPRTPSQSHKPKLLQSGFEEPRAAFAETSPSRERFSESVALLRAFNLISGASERRKVIDLARQLSDTTDE
jgi:hypothetical protein